MTDWTRVQGAQSQAPTLGLTVSIALTNPVASGNIMACEAIISNANQIISAVDDKGNNYTWVAPSFTVANPVVAFYPDPDSATFGLLTNGPKTLTVTLAATPSYFWYDLTEFSPPTGTVGTCLNGFNFNSGGLANATDIATFFVDTNDTLLYATQLSSGTGTTGAGWTAGAGSTTAVCSQWKILAAAGLTGTNSFATNTGSGASICIGIAPVKRNNWLPQQCIMNHSGITGTTISAGVQNGIGPGNYVWGMLADNNGAGGGTYTNCSTLVDDQGNNYKPNILNPNSNGRAIFWLGPINNGAKTLTLTTVASSTGLFLAFAEFRPPPGMSSATLDGSELENTAAGTSPQTIGPLTTSGAKELLFVMEEPASGQGNPTDGFAALVNGETWCMGYRNAPSAGSYSSSWSFNTAGSNHQYLAALKTTFSGGLTGLLALLGIGS